MVLRLTFKRNLIPQEFKLTTKNLNKIIMKTLKILIAVVAVTALTSCNFDINFGQVNGNGNVTTEERPVSSDFDQVKGSAGLDVYLTQGDENKIVVEADENLQEFIETEINNGKLHVTTIKSIGRSKAKKVHVTYVNVNHVAASSGADVIVNSVLKNENITLDASSGADLEVEIMAKEVFAETSSGADIKVTGKATSLKASASSGSELNARELLVINCKADASSGGDIVVNVKEKLQSEASSGGNIKYYGDPAAVSKNDSHSGSVRKM